MMSVYPNTHTPTSQSFPVSRWARCILSLVCQMRHWHFTALCTVSRCTEIETYVFIDKYFKTFPPVWLNQSECTVHGLFSSSHTLFWGHIIIFFPQMLPEGLCSCPTRAFYTYGVNSQADNRTEESEHINPELWLHITGDLLVQNELYFYNSLSKIVVYAQRPLIGKGALFWKEKLFKTMPLGFTLITMIKNQMYSIWVRILSFTCRCFLLT